MLKILSVFLLTTLTFFYASEKKDPYDADNETTSVTQSNPLEKTNPSNDISTNRRTITNYFKQAYYNTAFYVLSASLFLLDYVIAPSISGCLAIIERVVDFVD